MLSSPENNRSVLAGGGEMGALMRSIDWAKTPVGPPETWPQSLKTSISILLTQRTPVFIFWGTEHVQFYNDAYRPILGTRKHPAAMGQRGSDCWPEIWNIIEPMLAAVHRGESTAVEDGLLLINRTGYLEEGYYTYTYSPIRDESGAVGGVFCVVYDTTAHVIGERRLRTLRDLAMRSSAAKTAEDACRAAAETLAANPHDIPFAALYLYSADRAQAALVATAGISPGEPASPEVLRFDTAAPSVLAAAAANPELQVIEDLAARLGPLPRGAWTVGAEAGLVLPISVPGQPLPAGILVAGINPHKQLDPGYRTFFDLVAGQIGNAVAEAQAYEEERRRAEALAELDRAKTAFFSNVSHEFRTPLTLMLGPLEDMLASSGPPAVRRDDLETVHRNSLRLLKLVNTLLDFARIEAGRVEARYEPTDLPAVTAELASNFRSALERAGLRLVIDCPPVPEPVYVDREMWEKIVLNLVSNAFKFTFEGEVEVSVKAIVGEVQLSVRDTGIGISQNEIPHLFERFHRVAGATGRTVEGSGIGLALIQELVKLHGGSVRVESESGRGSVFTVSVPFGTAHLPPDRIGRRRPQASTAVSAQAYVEEALRWLPESPETCAGTFELPWISARAAEPGQNDASRARLLIADDNSDMRDYLRRLLAARYEVEAVADGEAALNAIKRSLPDLVVADVMMPRLDGFGLLRALRGNAAAARVPVILLSARAGEEARIEGLHAGADDYLVKPFSARELLARVSSRLEIARLQNEAAQKEKQLRLLAEAERQRFYNLLNEAPAVIAVLRGPDHVFELVNADYLRATGRQVAQDLVGKPIREALPEITGQQYVELLDRVYRTAESYVGFENLARLDRNGDGTLEDLYFNFVYQPLKDVQGKVEGILVHAVDVTEQVLARRRIEESERRFRQLADSMPQIVWAADAQGHSDYFNRRWYDYAGIVWADQKEPQWEDVLHPDDRGLWRERWNQAVRSKSRFQMECRLYDPESGSHRWHLARAVPVQDNLEGVRWYGTCTDIQEQKQTEEIVRQKQRLESTGLLAGGVAHDFNNLLTGVLGNASLLLEESWLANTARIMLQDIVDSAERAAHLTRQMLAYAGKGSFHFEPLDLSEQVRDAERLLRAAIPRKVQFRLALAGDLPRVEADVAQIHQVVMNLVVNAAEAIGSERSGCVTVTTAARTLGTPVTGAFIPEPPAPGPYTVLEVHDDGKGMEPAVLAKIFDPFFTTKFTGRGLGLSAVLGIVRSHRGAMQVESMPGQGSTFRVFLPAVAESGHNPGADCPTVLIVDDEEIVRRTARHALESHGYSVAEASNGEEGVRVFQQTPGRFNVVLLDLTMPVMDGEEALRQFRAIDAKVGIVLSSGYDERVATSRFAGLGLSGFIQKPYTAAGLRAVVEAVLNSKKLGVRSQESEWRERRHSADG